MKKFKEFLREEEESEYNYGMPFEDAEAYANISFAADPGGIFQEGSPHFRTRLNFKHPAIKFLFHHGHTEKSLDAASDHLLKLAKRELTGEEVKPYEAHPQLIDIISKGKDRIKTYGNTLLPIKENTNEEYEAYLDMPKKIKLKKKKKKGKKYTFPYYGYNFYGYNNNNNTEGESGGEGGGDGGGGE
jgi:hypothetical protein